MQESTTIGEAENTGNPGSENCLSIGTRVADFTITRVVGDGGFGIVYLAFDQSLHRTVAIKEYMPGALAGRGPDKSVVLRSQRHKETFQTGLKSFINEARLLAQFDHPALIKVYRFWEENNTAYMAMRYYEGQTVKSVIKYAPEQITEAWLKGMMKPMLEALDALYRVQILHRDISPDNIMIQENGEAVLLDFGAARQVIGGLTHALTVILKPGYAPVEQYADDSSMTQGPWTDIYSLSAVVYSAIVKTAPPTSVARLIKDPIEPLQNGQHPGFSKAFLAAIDKGMAVKPEDRPQSIEEFRQLLDLKLSLPTLLKVAEQGTSVPPVVRKNSRDKAKSKGSASAKPQSRPAQTVRPNRRRFDKPWYALSFVLVFLALGVFGYGVFKHFAKPRVLALAPQSTYTDTQAAALPIVEVTEQESTPVEEAKIHQAAASEKLTGSVVKSPDKKHDDAKLALSTVKGDAATIATPSADHSIPQPLASTSTATAIDADSADLTGRVRLNIKPWARIAVDGTWKGVSPPLKKLVLPEGKHTIKLVNPNFPEYVITVDVKTRRVKNIEYDFSSPH